MSAIPHTNSQPPAAPEIVARLPESEVLRSSPGQEIARLAALHEEARETARLANLLGRAPVFATALAAAGGLAVAVFASAARGAETATWLVLVLVGVGVVARSYAQAIRAPFERAPLVFFAKDLNAIMLYAGCAWGAGAFLLLPDTTNVVALVIFSAGGCALVAASLRGPEAMLWFVAPATALCASASILRPLEAGALGASIAFLACGAIVAAAVVAEGLLQRNPDVPRLADLPLT